MQAVKELLDNDFENYVLATDGKASTELPLDVGALSPLGVPPAATKEQWQARIFHNALTPDPFRTGSAYFVSRRGDIVHVINNAEQGLQQRTVFTLPHLAELHPDVQFDNVTMAALAPDLLLLSDGTGDLFAFGADASSGKWSLRFSGAPWGKPMSLALVDARLENDHFVHGVVSQLLFAAEGGAAFAVSAFTINLHSTSVTTTLLYKGTQAVHYASFASASDLLLLVEGSHELQVELRQTTAVPPATTVHKRPHSASVDGTDEIESTEVLKCPRAGIGFDGVHPSPHVPAADLGHVDAMPPLYDRFVASSTPFRSVDAPLHSGAAPAAPVPDESARIEIPTPDSILGGFEECDDLDPNATAVLYRYSFRDRAFVARRAIDCRSYHFLGASAAPLQTPAHPTKRLLFQYDVHGAVFRVELDTLALVHEATFQAFAYVQASKEQKKLLLFHPSASLAAVAEFEKRVFVYSGPQGTAAVHCRLHYLEELPSAHATILGAQFIDAATLLVLTPTAVVRVAIGSS
ncbi:hypothetical protein ACHHYP_16728 [Achlya hypogyna]|uniref:NudC domain-containing protein 1 n=1 Tax=Achlya hypogyna TaxID=1202772 RepID=A0A1V9Y5X8_ACHHY|nr:hypothetical protein ACHHYP_16728 [Achlya hypogyna]